MYSIDKTASTDDIIWMSDSHHLSGAKAKQLLDVFDQQTKKDRPN